MLKRKITQQLIDWKTSSEKAMLVTGARQIGKSYAIREFAKQEYQTYVEINLYDNKAATKALLTASSMDDFLSRLSLFAQTDMIPGNTLIFIDEVQEAPDIMTMVKFLVQDGRFDYIFSGSMLGTEFKGVRSYPVGYVTKRTMRPMDFEEFLMAMGEDQLLKLMHSEDYELMNAFHEKLKDYLRQYYYVGGMPEVVKSYVENKLLNQVRTIQNEILSNYASDFSKHAPTQEVPRIDMVWQSILGQLSKENKKFVYGVLKKGGRAKEFELAIQWLVDAGLAYKITKVTKPELPLKFYEDLSAFKLYLCDCGLMGAMADTAAKDVLLGDNVFTEYKGAFTEQYVLQQLLASGITHIYYYSSDTSRMEMDFLLQRDGALLPIEVKAGTSIKANSLHNFLMEHTDISAIRYSMLPYRKQENITNIPLYGVFLQQKNRN